jgi:hypothetical protein
VLLPLSSKHTDSKEQRTVGLILPAVVYGFLVGKLEGKRPLGRPRRKWEDNIKMNLQEVGYGGKGR